LSPNQSIKFIVRKSKFDLTRLFGLTPFVLFSKFSKTYYDFVTTAAILSVSAIVIACNASAKFQSISFKVSFSIYSRDETLFVQFFENSFLAVSSPKNSMRD